MPTKASDLNRRAWHHIVLFLLILAMLLFLPAWSLRFWQAWIYWLVFAIATIATSVYFLKHDPKLVERRLAIGPTAEQEPTQKIIMTVTSIGFLLLLVVPGFDYRWPWSAIPPWLVLVANGCVALGFVICFVVLKQNRYAAATVRVEAGQPVVSTGVYAIVRHPMYAGALLMLCFTPLALGSYWALLIAILLLPVLVWRLLDEENLLSRELPGYTQYCRKTRCRLIPLLW
jgi:protein-S-isoprenylcysteine O-methyltransferase Ste14